VFIMMMHRFNERLQAVSAGTVSRPGSATVRPSSQISPASGRSRPASSRRSVVFQILGKLNELAF
jgi:hypothetical protein